MDEGLLDAEPAMATFLKLIAAEPDIARVPIMIDSSKWSVIEAGLKCVAGKPIVNSISMKEGEEPVPRPCPQGARATAPRSWSWRSTRRARPTPRQRKVEICERAYKILVDQIGFPPEDIIFDPNIFAVATGIEEHNNYGVDFIEATREIKQRCPHVKISGGVSNLSFSFRGNEPVRKAMHSVFLYHAIQAGHGHGHRQCRPARGLRPDRPRAARRLRGRDPRTAAPTRPSGCSSSRRKYKGTGAVGRDAGRRMAQLAGRRSGWSMRWSRASTSSSSPTPRRRASRSPGRSR